MSGQLPLFEVFEAHVPAKPTCTDDFAAGTRILPKRAALRRRHIEPQPPWSHLWLLFDIDRDASWCAADEAGLPAPSILAVNPRNGHGHALYGLTVPLRMDTFHGRAAPVRYAETIERAMTAKLRADLAYSGFMCKNPLHRHWTVLQHDHLFTLRELHGWIGDLRPYRSRPARRRTGIGRNVATFDAARAWAYRAIREYWELPGADVSSFEAACIGAAERYDAEHNRPALGRSECRWIGRSVSKWTWRRFTPAEFSRVQAARGRGGKAVQAKRAERNRRIRDLAALGFTQRQIAAAVGCHYATVSRALREGLVSKPYQARGLREGLCCKAISG